MPTTPDFLDRSRPDVPALVVSGAVLPFRLADGVVRGRLIRLGPLADALLSRHDNPEPVQNLAGRALALAASLATALKFRGSFSVQAKGDGPVPMLLADCTDDGALRFYARVDPDAYASAVGAGAAPSDRTLLGDGFLAFSVDQGPDMDRHQGIVAIEGDTLDAMAAHYFRTSEQHDCRTWLACGRRDGAWRASALVLERIASGGGADGFRDLDPGDRPDGFEGPAPAGVPEEWRDATALAATLTEDELLDDALAPETLLYRLFHETGVAADLPRALAFGCRCSRAKLASILEGFPVDDLDHMVVDGDIVMRCEFCAHDFRFPRDSVRGADAAPADRSD